MLAIVEIPIPNMYQQLSLTKQVESLATSIPIKKPRICRYFAMFIMPFCICACAFFASSTLFAEFQQHVIPAG